MPLTKFILDHWTLFYTIFCVLVAFVFLVLVASYMAKRKDEPEIKKRLGEFLHHGESVERLIIAEKASQVSLDEQTAWMIAVWNFLKEHIGMGEAGQFKAKHQVNIRVPDGFPSDKIAILEQVRARKEFLDELIGRYK